MTLFRARQYGSALPWTLISINTPGEEESELADLLVPIIGLALATSSLHVQQMNDEGDWEESE